MQFFYNLLTRGRAGPNLRTWLTKQPLEPLTRSFAPSTAKPRLHGPLDPPTFSMDTNSSSQMRGDRAFRFAKIVQPTGLERFLTTLQKQLRFVLMSAVGQANLTFYCYVFCNGSIPETGQILLAMAANSKENEEIMSARYNLRMN